MAINLSVEATPVGKHDAQLAQLAEHGYTVFNDFISPEMVQGLRVRIDELRAEEDMRRAGIGRQAEYQLNKNVRGDLISWIEEGKALPITQQYLEQIEELKNELRDYLRLALKDYECHFTCYPAGTFYRKHVDRFKQQAHRLISLMLYLNEDWQPTNGGELVIYLESGEEVKVAPKAGSLAVFLSHLEHEVLVTHVPRYSITGWLLDKPLELTFL